MTVLVVIGIAIVTRRDEALRRRTVGALPESEQKYRQLFELVSDAVCLIDNENGRILDDNSVTVTLYGYSRDELLAIRNVEYPLNPTKRAAPHSRN